MVGGCFWQPLENLPGINDTCKINRYLTILQCRTARRISGCMQKNECLKCSIEHCPFSLESSKKLGASWEKEIQEHDYRMDLFKAISERVKNEMNLELQELLSHGENKALLIPNLNKKEGCTLYLPVDILNDILYHPGKRDWSAIASEFEFELGIFTNSDKVLVNLDEITVSPAEFCREFWREYGILDEWELAGAREECSKAKIELNEAEFAYINALSSYNEKKEHLDILLESTEKDQKPKNFFQSIWAKINKFI